jgi:hypothetical protein
MISRLQVVEVRVSEVELTLERPVRNTAALAQQREDLIQHGIKISLHLPLSSSQGAELCADPNG